MRLRRVLVLAAVLAVAAVACDRVVDLTPDARELGPDGGNPLPDAGPGIDGKPIDSPVIPDAPLLG
jgi:hypothetical protein